MGNTPQGVQYGAWGLRALAAAGGAGLVLMGSALALASHWGSYRAYPLLPPPPSDPGPPKAEIERLRSRLAEQRPRGPYVVVDTFRNRLRLYRDGELLREAVCSAGSGAILRDPRSGRLWVFDTPIGERRVERKVRNPIWVKPDWAFIEEGYLPPKEPTARYDRFSLGDYGIYLGDGYIIHGTLFETLLGRPVTHGCIRLGDDDLAFIFRNLHVGARVYLY